MVAAGWISGQYDLIGLAHVGEHVRGSSHFNNLAASHQRHTVADIPHEVHIVRDHDERLVHLVPRVQDRVLHVLPGDWVHRAGRLIENDETRLLDEHLGERDPVPLAIGQFAREPVEDLL